MTPGDTVTWPGGDTMRVGTLIRFIEPNEEPTLSPGVSRRKARFRPGLALSRRALCREDATGLYYAPRAESVTVTGPRTSSPPPCSAPP